MGNSRLTEDKLVAGRGPTRDSIQTMLARDHERLDQLFRSVMSAMDGGDLADLRCAWLAFESELERHLDVEEKHVVPLFARSKPKEAQLLKEEHGQLRAGLLDMGIDLDLHCLERARFQAFADTLRAHARHEDALFHPWANRHLDSDAAASMREALGAGVAGTAKEADFWWIDADSSSLEFSLRHIVVGQIRGRFTRWGGSVRLDAADVQKARVRVWVDLASVDTGDRERDDQVRSPEFFDVARFRRAVFTSTEVQLPEGRHPIVLGSLDLHGVKAEVLVEITDDLPWRSDPAAPMMSFAGRARLDRRHFSLRWNQDLDIGGVVVGDQVEVTARVELVRASAARLTHNKP
jgi:polyisoprenoid-binding protein YceI